MEYSVRTEYTDQLIKSIVGIEYFNISKFGDHYYYLVYRIHNDSAKTYDGYRGYSILNILINNSVVNIEFEARTDRVWDDMKGFACRGCGSLPASSPDTSYLEYSFYVECDLHTVDFDLVRPVVIEAVKAGMRATFEDVLWLKTARQRFIDLGFVIRY